MKKALLILAAGIFSASMMFAQAPHKTEKKETKPQNRLNIKKPKQL